MLLIQLSLLLSRVQKRVRKRFGLCLLSLLSGPSDKSFRLNIGDKRVVCVCEREINKSALPYFLHSFRRECEV